MQHLFPLTSAQAPLDTFSLLLIGQGFPFAASALYTCSRGWERARAVAPLNLFNPGGVGAYTINVYIEIGDSLDLGLTQSGNALAISETGMSALDTYLNNASTTTDGSSYSAAEVWPSFGRSGEFRSLIAIVVFSDTLRPGPAERYHVQLSEGYIRSIVAVVATGDWWHMVLARAVAQAFAGLGDEYELDGSTYAQVPDTFWVPQTNIIYVLADQRTRLANGDDPVTVIGFQNFPASWSVRKGDHLTFISHPSEAHPITMNDEGQATAQVGGLIAQDFPFAQVAGAFNPSFFENTTGNMATSKQSGEFREPLAQPANLTHAEVRIRAAEIFQGPNIPPNATGFRIGIEDQQATIAWVDVDDVGGLSRPFDRRAFDPKTKTMLSTYRFRGHCFAASEKRLRISAIGAVFLGLNGGDGTPIAFDDLEIVAT